jgi:septum formation protein
MPKRLILASASPRRRELLGLLRLPFEVIVSDVDEGPESVIGPRMERAGSLKPMDLANALSWEKAMRVWSAEHDPDAIVLGSDTVVVADRAGIDTAIGKPKDAEEARSMLALLSGATHTVHTSVTLLMNDPELALRYCDLTRVIDTRVTFRALSGEMIEAYIATGEPFDKAGAYGIQGYASAFVEAIQGDYFNVVGLPVATVARMLEEIGVEWWRGPEALTM